MQLNKSLMLFKEYLINYNYSKRTQKGYIQQTNKFLLFVMHNYPSIKSLEKINKQVILDYLSYLTNYKDNRGKPLTTTTICIKLKILRAFFKYLLKNDLILKNPILEIELPRTNQSLPRGILSIAQVETLLNSVKLDSPINIRNKSIIELFYDIGIRTSECCNLKIGDVDLKEHIITIEKGKGGKTRILPLGQYAAYYLNLYFKSARKYFLKNCNQDEGYIYLTKSGRKFTRDILNREVIQKIAKNANFKKNITCYTFRHSIATHLLQQKVDIRYISQLLGHSSLNTTKRYTRVDITDLKKVHSLYHPREMKNKPIIEEEKDF